VPFLFCFCWGGLVALSLPAALASSVLFGCSLFSAFLYPALALTFGGVGGPGGGVDLGPEHGEVELLARNSPGDGFSLLVCLLDQRVRGLEDVR